MNKKANLGVYHASSVDDRVLRKLGITTNDLPTMAYFNKQKSNYEKDCASYLELNSSQKLISHCESKLKEENPNDFFPDASS